MRRTAVALMLVLLAPVGCNGNGGRAQAPADIPSGARVLSYDYAGGRNVRALGMRGGIACQADGVLGPMTYNAADAGKPGIPRLAPDDAKILTRIRHFVPSRTLRFTRLGGQFVVYDAIYGVCTGGVYWAMSLGCNELYSPTDTRIDHQLAGTGCRGTPAPWLLYR